MAKGRPRKFNADKAIDLAMLVFWMKGYEGTSLSDLTEEMGISRPSLYAAFGNKESLFLKVLDRYREDPASYLNVALERSSAREVFESLLYGAIDLQTGPDNPCGCLFVNGALAVSKSGEPIKRELAARRMSGEDAIRRRFERAVKEGDLAPDVNPANLAKFVVTILHGMAVQASSGDSHSDLSRVAEIALQAFPNGRK